jgi:hypothetical protein
MKARSLILTTGVTLALVAPAAHATTTGNALRTHTAKAAKARAHQRTAARAHTALSVTWPAAPGSGVPVRATTSDDYDSPDALYGPATAGDATPATAPALTPQLVDGYLL